MTKREKTVLVNKITRIEKRLATKRDETRKILSDIEGLVDSFSSADDSIESALNSLRSAREELDHAADRMSEQV